MTNLVLYQDLIASGLSNDEQVDSIYIDFPKAFDSVNHSRLLDKLWNFGIRRRLHDWFSSYLYDRKLAVRVSNFISEYLTASSRGSQGSYLGPILFIIFMNDITGGIPQIQTLIYANDAKIFTAIKSPLDATRLQRALTHIFEWSQCNGLKINMNGCADISSSKSEKILLYQYQFNDVIIEHVEDIPDLGITLEFNLRFDSHIESVCNEAL